MTRLPIKRTGIKTGEGHKPKRLASVHVKARTKLDKSISIMIYSKEQTSSMYVNLGDPSLQQLARIHMTNSYLSEEISFTVHGQQYAEQTAY
jgi:hypothetical protein